MAFSSRATIKCRTGVVRPLGLFIREGDMRGVIGFNWSDDLGRYQPEAMVGGIGVKEIVALLSDEVQVHAPNLVEFIDQTEEIVSGARTGYISTGNAHHFMAAAGNVFLECEFVDDFKVLLAARDFLALLNKYKIVMDAGHVQYYPPDLIEFEYIEEGEAALDMYVGAGGKLGVDASRIKKR